MKIEILYVPGCPNYQPTFDRLQSGLGIRSGEDWNSGDTCDHRT